MPYEVFCGHLGQFPEGKIKYMLGLLIYWKMIYC